MNKKDEALRLALETLEQLDGIDTETECVTIDVGDVMTAVREALAEQPAQQQELVAFYVYKPTLPRGNLGVVADGNLPWVYDQDSASGFSARMLVMPVTSPPQRKPMTDKAKAVIDAARAAMDDSVEAYDSEGSIKISSHLAASLSLCLDEYDRAIEAAHGIKDPMTITIYPTVIEAVDDAYEAVFRLKTFDECSCTVELEQTCHNSRSWQEISDAISQAIKMLDLKEKP